MYHGFVVIISPAQAGIRFALLSCCKYNENINIL